MPLNKENKLDFPNDLISMFNGIWTFMGYIIPKQPL